jgi:hypothetical protein
LDGPRSSIMALVFGEPDMAGPVKPTSLNHGLTSKAERSERLGNRAGHGSCDESVFPNILADSFTDLPGRSTTEAGSVHESPGNRVSSSGARSRRAPWRMWRIPNRSTLPIHLVKNAADSTMVAKQETANLSFRQLGLTRQRAAKWEPLQRIYGNDEFFKPLGAMKRRLGSHPLADAIRIGFRRISEDDLKGHAPCGILPQTL